MNIARLNVIIDPTKASSGSTAAVQAANAVRKSLEEAAKAAKTLGTGFDDMARKTSQNGGVMRSAFGAMMSGVTSLKNGILTLGAAFGALQLAMLPIMATMRTVTAIFGVFSASVHGAADFEDYTIQFAQLLGSFEKADTKLRELSDIAARTPFNLPEIVRGTVTLQSLSNGLLATRENLIMIGDAVAKSRYPFDEMSVTIGRLYANVKNGISSAFEVNRLIETGVITENAVKIRRMMEFDNKGGKNAAEIWGMITDNMRKAQGSMALMSQTTNGLFSTLQDEWGALQRTVGASINDGLRPVIRAITEEIAGWNEKLKEFAPAISDAAVKVAAVINIMRQPGGFKLALTAGMDEFKDFMRRVMEASGAVLSAVMIRAANELQKFMNRPDLFRGLTTALYNAGVDFVNVITAGIAGIPSKLKAALMTTQMSAMTPGGSSTLAKVLGGAAGISSYFRGTSEAPQAAPAPMPEPVNPWALPRREMPSMTGAPYRSVPGNPLLPEINWQNAWNATAPGFSVDSFLLSLKTGVESLFIQGQNAQSRNDSLLAPQRSLALRPADELARMDMDAAEQAKKAADEAKKAAKEMQSSAKEFIDATRTPMETYKLAMSEISKLEKAGYLNAEDAGRARVKAQNDYQEALKRTEEAMKRLAAKERTQFQETMAFWADSRKMFAELQTNAAYSFANNFTNAFSSFVMGTKTAKEAFSEMARQIIADIITMTTRMLIMQAIGKISGGGSAGGGGGGGWGALIGAVVGAILHDGGEVGAPAPTRVVSADTFRNARRYEHGGVVGSGETPIIAEKGETVLTRQQASDIKGRLGRGEAKKESAPSVTVVNVVDSRLVEQQLMQNSRPVLNIISANARLIKKMISSA